MQKIKEVISEGKFKYISFFWLLVSIQFIIGSNLQIKGYSIGNFSENIISIIKIIVFSIIFIFFHYCVLKIVKEYKSNNAKVDKKTRKFNKKYEGVIYFLIIILCWIPALLAFYPSIFNYDGPMQILTFINKQMDEGFSLISTLLLGSFYKVGLNINNVELTLFLYTVFQVIIMASIFSYTIKFINNKTKSKVYTYVILLFYAIFPYNQLFPLMTTKDTLFAGLMLLFIIKLYKIMTEKNKVMDYLFIILIGSLTALFRSNCIYTFFVMIPCIIFILNKNKELYKKLLVVFILTIIGYNVANNLLIKVTNAESISGQIGTTIFSQAVGKVCQEKREYLTDEEKDKINYYYGSYEKLAKLYRGNISDFTNNLIQYDNIESNKGDFFNFVIKLGMKYPIEYIDSFLNTNRGYWYINDTSFCNIWSHKDKGALELTFFKTKTVESRSYLPGLQKIYKKLFAENNFLYIPVFYILFQPSFYFYILIASILYSIYKKDRKMLVLQVILLLYFATCFFGPCAIIRYIYAIIVSVPIMALSGFKDIEKE